MQVLSIPHIPALVGSLTNQVSDWIMCMYDLTVLWQVRERERRGRERDRVTVAGCCQLLSEAVSSSCVWCVHVGSRVGLSVLAGLWCGVAECLNGRHVITARGMQPAYVPPPPPLSQGGSYVWLAAGDSTGEIGRASCRERV